MLPLAAIAMLACAGNPPAPTSSAVTRPPPRPEIADPVDAGPDPVPVPSRVVGTIVDRMSGESLAGATVVVTSPTLDGSRAVLTDRNGTYELRVPPGDATVSVYYGYAKQHERVVLNAGEVVTRDFAIETRSIAEPIVVPLPRCRICPAPPIVWDGSLAGLERIIGP